MNTDVLTGIEERLKVCLTLRIVWFSYIQARKNGASTAASRGRIGKHCSKAQGQVGANLKLYNVQSHAVVAVT